MYVCLSADLLDIYDWTVILILILVHDVHGLRFNCFFAPKRGSRNKHEQLIGCSSDNAATVQGAGVEALLWQLYL